MRWAADRLQRYRFSFFRPRAILKIWKRSYGGGADKIHEADCVILGGHSVSEDEVKFGYAVTGLIDARRVLTNAGALAGDVLVFTKRIGTGVISTALKQGTAEETHVQGAIDQMLDFEPARVRGDAEV